MHVTGDEADRRERVKKKKKKKKKKREKEKRGGESGGRRRPRGRRRKRGRKAVLLMEPLSGLAALGDLQLKSPRSLGNPHP